MIAMSVKNPRMTSPATAFELRRNTNRPGRRRRRGTDGMTPVTGAPDGPVIWSSSMSVMSTVMSALLPGAGVERGVDEVGEDVRYQHGQGDDEEAALHERVVLGVHRVEEHEADALVAEDHLHDERAADDEDGDGLQLP